MFGQMIAGLLPFFPKGLVRKVAGRYIAGDNARDAVELAAKLEARGFLATLDMLGEDTLDMEGAAKAVAGYRELMMLMSREHIERNISIKLSQLGLRIDRQGAFDNLMRVIEEAERRDFFVRIDMEDSSTTDDTLEFYLRAKEQWPKVGTVLQSRLKRTESDARVLSKEGANFRLCKGIYLEKADIAFTDPQEIRESYLRTFEVLLNGGAYVGLATHDLPMLERAEETISIKNIETGRFEYQALLGVPMRHKLEQLRDRGNKVRLYVPFGEDWYAYSLRRLNENPEMAGAITRGIFSSNKLDMGTPSSRKRNLDEKQEQI